MIEKVNLRQVLVIAGIGLAVYFMFSMFGKPNSNTVHNYATGTIRVGKGLEQARGNQRIVEERIGSAATRVERIESSVTDCQGRIGNAQNRVGTIKSLISEAEGIARTDRRILQAVKTRAKAGISSEGK
ncbi:MAG: hypothetical protein IKK97_02280 [Phascolarctobacterium sp.]|nr:hypothetical protein [Phascolarctobacterium sp.]